MSDRIRHKLWFWLICLADRISPKDAFRATGFRMRFVLHQGVVFDTIGDKGAMLWGQDRDKELAFDGEEFFRE